MDKYIDLHTHTTSSDGLLEPAELIKTAASIGLSAIAITDHDTIDGIYKAKEEALKYNIELINGIELSAESSYNSHILGYFVDIENNIFKSKLKTISDKRLSEIIKVFSCLRKLDIKISPNEVVKQFGALSINGIAKTMCLKGYTDSTDEAFHKYLSVNRPAYVKKSNLTPKEAIELIKIANGIAVLAHPCRLGVEESKFLEILEELISYGLDGIEVFHCDQKNYGYYKKIATQYDLILSGGSDFHGDGTSALGEANNNKKIMYEILNSLKKYYRLHYHIK